MKRTNVTGICGLSRQQLTVAGVPRPAVTLDVARLWAYQSNAPQVIACVTDPSRVLVVTPGGGTPGASGKPMGFAEAEEYAWALAARMGWNDPAVVMDGRVGE